MPEREAIPPPPTTPKNLFQARDNWERVKRQTNLESKNNVEAWTRFTVP